MMFGLLGPPLGGFSNILVKTRQTTQTKKPRYPRDSIATQRWVGGAFQRGPGEARDAILGKHFWASAPDVGLLSKVCARWGGPSSVPPLRFLEPMAPYGARGHTEGRPTVCLRRDGPPTPP